MFRFVFVMLCGFCLVIVVLVVWVAWCTFVCLVGFGVLVFNCVSLLWACWWLFDWMWCYVFCLFVRVTWLKVLGFYVLLFFGLVLLIACLLCWIGVNCVFERSSCFDGCDVLITVVCVCCWVIILVSFWISDFTCMIMVVLIVGCLWFAVDLWLFDLWFLLDWRCLFVWIVVYPDNSVVLFCSFAYVVLFGWFTCLFCYWLDWLYLQMDGWFCFDFCVLFVYCLFSWWLLDLSHLGCCLMKLIWLLLQGVFVCCFGCGVLFYIVDLLVGDLWFYISVERRCFGLIVLVMLLLFVLVLFVGLGLIYSDLFGLVWCLLDLFDGCLLLFWLFWFEVMSLGLV